MSEDIKKISKIKDVFVIKCPYCEEEREIEGNSETAVKFNLHLHIQQKHSDKLYN